MCSAWDEPQRDSVGARYSRSDSEGTCPPNTATASAAGVSVSRKSSCMPSLIGSEGAVSGYSSFLHLTNYIVAVVFLLVVGQLSSGGG